MTSKSRTIHRRHLGVIVALIGAVLALAGCGSSSTPASTQSPSTSSQSTSSQSTTTSSTAAPVSAAQEIATAGVTSSKAFCGTKPITLGIEDGVGTNSWSQYSMAAVRSEAAKCPNVKTVEAIGQGNLQTAISNINGLVAQGINALVVVPDFGAAELPALRAATKAGVKVVAWGANPGGTVGTDYLDYVDWNPVAGGEAFANWMAQALHGKGNVVYLGGPAGNPVGLGMLKGFHTVFQKYPGIKLLTGYKSWAVMNWDPAEAQKVMAALLAKYPNIDGVLSEDGLSMVDAMRAFTNANRPLVPFTGLEANGFACAYQSLKATNPKLQEATISGRSWLGRIAARKAIAAAEGLSNNEPSIYNLPLLANTLTGNAPKCVKSASPGAFFSNRITAQQLKQYGNVS